MKTIPLALTFAAFASTLAAQDPPAKPKLTPSQELAKIVAVEEQERDLAKAETLYREALAGKDLSAAARAVANRRLGALLVRLGREQDAASFVAAGKADGGTAGFDDFGASPQQEREREAALRERARELVKQVFTLKDPSAQLHEVLEQLRWIGAPAVPEVAARLAAESPLAVTNQWTESIVTALAGFLWTFGGEAAAAHLQDLVRDGKPAFRRMLYAGASDLREQGMARLAVKLAGAEADEGLIGALLYPQSRVWYLETDALVDVMVAKGPTVRTAMLRRLTWDEPRLRPEAMAKVHGVVRQALSSSDPELGRAAHQFLVCRKSQETVAGFELLREELPRIRLPNRQTPVMTMLPSEWLRGIGDDRRMDPAIAAKLWPRLVSSAKALDRDSPHWMWLMGPLHACARELDAGIVPDVLGFVAENPSRWNGLTLLRDKITDANALQVLGLYERLDGNEPRMRLLEELNHVRELPTALYEPLARCVATMDPEQQRVQAGFVARLLATTGHGDAAAWILREWQQRHLPEADAAKGLVDIGRRNQDESVRAAMRTMGSQVKGDVQSRLYLSLLAMHDTQALAQMTKDMATHGAVEHPYAKAAKSPVLTPLGYVLYEQPDPPHGFTMAELLAFVRTIGAWEGPIHAEAPARLLRATKRVPTELVLALAESSGQGWGNQKGGEWFTWPKVAARRLEQEPDMDGPLHLWWDEHLQKAGPVVWGADAFGERDLRHFRPRLEALLAGDDAALAALAFHVLQQHDLPLDFETLTQSKHSEVAGTALNVAMDRGVLSVQGALRALAVWPNFRDSIARYCGAKVAVEAVPALLQLLQDPELLVRERAAEALTRIRFHHEQQAHWDRVLKGLDASPASAAEKLLLQGKPGAPKEQRLLAIASLGTLGVPEALPFLIEWTQDADADVAKKAKDAITQIHLNPRK